MSGLPSFLDAAARSGDEHELRRLVVEQETSLRRHLSNCLIQASEHGRRNIVDFLLSKGANIHYVRDFTYYTSIIIASQNGHLEIVKELLSHGANVNDVDNVGRTAMCYATNESIEAVLRNWPTTMGILVLQELGLYTQPEAKFYIDLKDYIG